MPELAARRRWRTLDREKRRDLSLEATRIVHEDMPWLLTLR